MFPFTQAYNILSSCHSPVSVQIDPNDVGRIEAMQAANFLKKSGLSVVVLSRVN